MAPAPTAAPLTPAHLTAQLEHERALSCSRLKATWEQIFAKYGKNTDDEADIIDTRTGEIIVDNGHLRALPDEDEGGWGDVVGAKRKRGTSAETGRAKRRRAEAGEEAAAACECDELEGTCPHKANGEEAPLPVVTEEEKEEVEEPAEEVREEVRASSPVHNGRSSPLATRERRRSARTKNAASPEKPAPVEQAASTVTETSAKTPRAAKTPKPSKAAPKPTPEKPPKSAPKQTPKTPAVPEEDDDLDELSMAAPTPSRTSTMTPSFALATPLRVRKNLTETPVPSRTRSAAKPAATPATNKKPNAAPPATTPAIRSTRSTRRASTSSTTTDSLPPPPLPVTTPTTARRRRTQLPTSSPFRSPRSVTKTYKTPHRTTSSPRKPAPEDPWAPPPPEENPFYDPKWDDEHPDGRPPAFPPNPLLAELAGAPTYTPKKRRGTDASGTGAKEKEKGGGFMTPAPVKARKEALVERVTRSAGASVRKKGKEVEKEVEKEKGVGNGVRASAKKEKREKAKGKMGPPPTPRRGLLDFLAEKEEKDKKQEGRIGENRGEEAVSGGDEGKAAASDNADSPESTASGVEGSERQSASPRAEAEAANTAARPADSSGLGKEKGAIESQPSTSAPDNEAPGLSAAQAQDGPAPPLDSAPATEGAQSKQKNATTDPPVDKAPGSAPESVKDSGYMSVIDAPQSAKKCGTHGYKCEKTFCIECSGQDGEEDDLVLTT